MLCSLELLLSVQSKSLWCQGLHPCEINVLVMSDKWHHSKVFKGELLSGIS